MVTTERHWEQVPYFRQYTSFAQRGHALPSYGYNSVSTQVVRTTKKVDVHALPFCGYNSVSTQVVRTKKVDMVSLPMVITTLLAHRL